MAHRSCIYCSWCSSIVVWTKVPASNSDRHQLTRTGDTPPAPESRHWTLPRQSAEWRSGECGGGVCVYFIDSRSTGSHTRTRYSVGDSTTPPGLRGSSMSSSPSQTTDSNTRHGGRAKKRPQPLLLFCCNDPAGFHLRPELLPVHGTRHGSQPACCPCPTP